MSRRGIATLAALLAALVLVTGCSGYRPVVRDDAPVHPGWSSCSALHAFTDGAPPDELTGGVPDDFRTDHAVLCRTRSQERGPGVGIEERADRLGGLLAYLDQPSQVSRHPETQACAAMAWIPPWLVLVDADGRYLLAALPTDVCGFPLGIFDDTPTPFERVAFGRVSRCLVAADGSCR